MFILKGVKVVCFDTLLQVLILKGVSGTRCCGPHSTVEGGEREATPQAGRGWRAMFTAHDSRRGTRGQLVGGTVEVQVVSVFGAKRRIQNPHALKDRSMGTRQEPARDAGVWGHPEHSSTQNRLRFLFASVLPSIE